MKRQTDIILLVEDDENDRFLFDRAWKAAGAPGHLRMVNEGIEAIRYLDGAGPYADRALYPFPATIVLDLKMPHANGFDVLRHIRKCPEWAIVPVIVLTASADMDDIKKAYIAGANTYFLKPHSLDALRDLVQRMHAYWSRAEAPQIDENGVMLATHSEGKMGEDVPAFGHELTDPPPKLP